MEPIADIKGSNNSGTYNSGQVQREAQAGLHSAGQCHLAFGSNLSLTIRADIPDYIPSYLESNIDRGREDSIKIKTQVSIVKNLLLLKL